MLLPHLSFSFTYPATTALYTLSLHDALPIFARQAFGLFGNARRAEFAGPGFNNTDLALYKDFPLHSEGPMKIELRLESFNIANHAHFANPNGNVNSANFGRVTYLLTGDPGSPRVTQLAAKFYF